MLCHTLTLLGLVALAVEGAFDSGLPQQQGIEIPYLSLNKPYLDANTQIPNWKFKGDTIVTKNYVRLTKDQPSQKGTLWNYVPNKYHNWEALFEFCVSGENHRLYGDGFVFWYTKDWGMAGEVFGNQNFFSGLALFFDTYSNHQGEHNHGHPYVSAMINDGTKTYDHDADGTHTELAGCQASFRHEKPSKARVSYFNRTLAVDLDFMDYNSWHRCFQVDGIDLPSGYHFGFSAVTGALHDNHDIHSMRVQGFDVPEVKQAEKMDHANMIPKSDRVIQNRAHVDPHQPSMAGRAVYKGFWAIFYIAILLVVVLAVVFVVRIKMRERDLKRF